MDLRRRSEKCDESKCISVLREKSMRNKARVETHRARELNLRSIVDRFAANCTFLNMLGYKRSRLYTTALLVFSG